MYYDNGFNQQMPPIESVVLKFFIRELKLRGMYRYFVDGMPSAGTFYYAFRKKFFGQQNNESNSRVNSDSPFMRAKNFEDAVQILIKLNKSIDGRRPPMSGMDENSQRVTMTINHLIHFILERHAKNMDILNSVGQCVFNNVCNCLFGQEYTDEQNRLEKEGRVDTSDPQKMWNLYMEASANGFKGSFDEFTSFVRMINENPQMLGKIGHQIDMDSPFNPFDDEDSEEYDGEDPEEYDGEDSEDYDDDWMDYEDHDNNVGPWEY